MTPQGEVIFGAFVVVMSIVGFIVGLVGLCNYTAKTIRRISGLLCFSSAMTLILVSNLLYRSV